MAVRPPVALIPPLLVCLVPLAACSSTPQVSGGTTIPAGGSATLATTDGSADVALRSDAAAELPLEIRAGTAVTGLSAMAPVRDTLAPGVQRWWNFEGPMTFTITNPGSEAAPVTYRVRGSGVSLQSGPTR